ncbi:unnamed protein product [Somion occarium]|uniref:Nitrate/nitrite transporter n=1 Tax=Somion occarium TaxID=3059160 RepID=A0ABP1D520_9APHY
MGRTLASVSSKGSSEARTLWEVLTTVAINPSNGKCRTLPILSLNNQYSRNFHLSWLGFWVAFLSCQQIGNSNIISLCATLGVRLIVGPLVDRYGPRKVMAGLLAIGAIPSGLAGTVKSVQGLYLIRFFIGVLGGTFVPCQAWTTAFFDNNVVGTANALVGGWGNSGGGFTFIIMVALYDRLVKDGLSSHTAWRVAFAIVPVPVLLSVSVATLVFGTDRPREKLENHSKASDSITHSISHDVEDRADATVPNYEVPDNTTRHLKRTGLHVLVKPSTWLPSLAYLTTFGYELAIDANLANVLFGLYQSNTFGQTKAGYIASVFGLLNLFTRPLGGYFGDLVFRKYRVVGKKYWMLACGMMQGVFSVALGVYIDQKANPSLPAVVVLFTLTAVVNGAANGANFALVPHCNPEINGFMSGLVGAMGNLGGVVFALVFRFQPRPFGKAFWLSGIIAAGVNVLLALIPVPEIAT